MTAAGDMGIPQVVAPGGLDLINFGPGYGPEKVHPVNRPTRPWFVYT